METVEKCRKPLICLLLRLWKNMWMKVRIIHTPVGKMLHLSIFDLRWSISCRAGLHMMHNFYAKGSFLAAERGSISPKMTEYPQTHKLWITFAVDAEIPPNPGFLRAGSMLSTGFPHGVTGGKGDV